MPEWAFAQQWPTRPIRAIVPFSAGSTIDIIGRIVLEPLSMALGQNIVVENRGGAGGTIGSALVARAEPDGYTILIHAAAHSAAPAAYPNAPYDAGRDLSGVSIFGTVPNVLVVSPAKGFKTIQQLVEAAKKGNMTFASAGVGSATHWAAERLRLAAGFDAVHVPFRGGPEALTEVLTGRVDFMCIGISSGLQFIRSGQLLPLAVSTLKRSSALPNVQTTTEAGYPNSDYTFWNGMLVPAKTPYAIIKRLHQEMQKVLLLPVVTDKFKVQGIEPMPLTPAKFDAMIAQEIKNNLAIVKAAGLKFN
jgi:tripartite-type tricarboxylate transporter receptor subunit TctC